MCNQIKHLSSGISTTNKFSSNYFNSNDTQMHLVFDLGKKGKINELEFSTFKPSLI